MSLDFYSAFLIGLLGSGHCLGMCGGITTMLTTAIKPINTSPNTATHTSKNNKTLLVICYHFGRILSYSFIGFIVAFTGSMASKSIGLPLQILHIIAGVFLILLGLYIGQWLYWLTYIEKLGKYIWQVISPSAKKLLPVQTSPQAFLLGVLWGWLPCGLVYSTLTWSLASGSGFQGASIMFAFGLGTLPALIALSFGLPFINQLITSNLFRKASAILLILWGINSLTIA